MPRPTTASTTTSKKPTARHASKEKEKDPEREATLPTVEAIIALRKSLDLSQTDMAKELDIDLSSYARVEHKVYRPSVFLLLRIMQRFGKTAFEVLIPPQSPWPEEKTELIQKLFSDIGKCTEDDLHALNRIADNYKRGRKVHVSCVPIPQDTK